MFLLLLAGCPDRVAVKHAPGADDTGVTPSTLCDVPTMDEQFPTMTDPYADFTDADACVGTRHDAILILGCPSNDDGTPSTCQQERVDIALGLRSGGLGERFIVSGGAVYNDFVEGEALAALLVEAGVDEADVFVDPLAEHTDENLYYGTRIMQEQAFTDAIVVSEDPGHIVYSAVSDANCCVKLGRLSAWDFPIGGGEAALLGHYALYPWAETVTDAECEHIEGLFMSTNLSSRRACADDFQLPE